MLSQLIRKHDDVQTIILGSGTGSGTLARAIREAFPAIHLHLIDEKGTTLLARDRYFIDHPPRGWKALIPTSLQVPPEPIDDYAALILAEKFLANRTE
jgi:cysteine synthase